MNDQHPVSATGPEECCYLLDIVGVDRNAILTARHMEAYMTWLYALPDAPDTLASLLYAHSCLFRAAAGRDNGTPLFKDIFHMLFLDAMLDLYPDAVIVHPYRKAEDIVLSACDAYSSLAQLHWPEMTQEIRHSMGARVLRLFTECMRRFCDTVERRGLLRSQRFVLVPYTTLVAEPLTVVRRVCAARGLELSAQVEEQILHCAQRPHKGRYAQLCCLYVCMSLCHLTLAASQGARLSPTTGSHAQPFSLPLSDTLSSSATIPNSAVLLSPTSDADCHCSLH